jgi:hypothetical protein
MLSAVQYQLQIRGYYNKVLFFRLRRRFYCKRKKPKMKHLPYKLPPP